MGIEQIQQKISKLLALSQSPNENEAQAALLKARALMAQYKLRPNMKMNSDVVYKGIGITFTLTSEPWMISLCRTISINYCCRPVLSCQPGKRTYEIWLIGLSEDFEICKTAIQYAVDCVRTGANRCKADPSWTTVKQRREAAKSYGIGFAEGLNEAFQKQSQSNQPKWGLVMRTPSIINKFIADLGIKNRAFNINLSNDTEECRAAGKEDGKMMRSSFRNLVTKG